MQEAGDDEPRRFEQKSDAVEAGKTLAQGNGPSQLEIYGSDGALEATESFEKDPLVTQLEKFGF